MISIPRPSSNTLLEGLKTKVTVITGSASGIGFATAKLFAEHGAQVVVVDLDADASKAAAQSIGHGAVSKACNVGSWEDQIEMFDWVISKFGALDIVISNAGIDPELAMCLEDGNPIKEKARGRVYHNFLANEMEGSRLKVPSKALFDVNLFGPIYNTKLSIHYMKRLGRPGRIILVGSANAYLPLPETSLYCASKHGVLGFMRSISKHPDVREAGITITMLCPWTTTTPLIADSLKSIPRGSVVLSQPEDLAWAAGYISTSVEGSLMAKAIWVQGSQMKEVEDAFMKFTASLSDSHGWEFVE